jgi:ligand-binding sensor domain-containing protein
MTAKNLLLGSLSLLLCLCAPARGQRPIAFENLSVKNGLSQSSVNGILEDRDGFFWFSTNDGLNRYDGYNFTVYKHDSKEPGSIPNSMVTRMLADGDGDIWLLSFDNGAIHYRRSANTFTAYRHDPANDRSLSSDHAYSLYRDVSGDIWIGADNGLNRYQAQSGDFQFFPMPPDEIYPSANPIMAICQDSAGLFWLATYAGLKSFDKATCVYTSYRNNPEDAATIAAGGISAISIDAAGDIWIGFYDKGLDRYDRAQGRFIHYQHDREDAASIGSNRITSLAFDGQGQLWVGTREGLDIWNAGAKKFFHYRLNANGVDNNVGNIVNTIYIDRRGIVWIGTQLGIDKYDPHIWKFMPYRFDTSASTNQTDNYIYAICEDREGGVWLGNNQRLQRFDAERQSFRPYLSDSAALNRQLANIKTINAILEDDEGRL